jgi:PAS domain S-box-containing protein
VGEAFHVQESRKEVWADIAPRIQAIILAEPVPAPEPKTPSIQSWDWLWNVEDTTICYSPRLREWLGCTEDELRNCFHDWLERIHPEDMPEVAQRTHDFFDGNLKRYELKFRLRKNDGEYLRFTTCGKTVKRGGKIKQLFGQYTLIASEAEKTNEIHLQEMIQAVPCGVSMLDLSGCFVFVNQAFADSLGFDAAELKGRRWGDMVHPEDLEAVSLAYETMMSGDRAQLACRILHKKGTIVNVEMLLARRQDSGNSAAGHFCFCRPIEKAA